MNDEEILRQLDAQQERDWLVPPWHQIQPEDRLKPAELDMLHQIIRRRAPGLMPQLQTLGTVVQRPSARARLRYALVDELTEFGMEDDDLNDYGRQVDNLMAKLGRI